MAANPILDPRLIRELRLRRGLGVPQLAEAAGIGVTTLYQIERGECVGHGPRISTVGRLAEALGVEVAELFALDASEEVSA